MNRQLDDATTWLKRAMLLVIVGLIVQLFCLVQITPGSFLLFAGAGAGPVFIGLLLFAYVAVRRRRGRDG